MSPQHLVDQLKNHGRIDGSTATFGAPYFGQRVLGRLAYASDANRKAQHCTKDYDLDACGSSSSMPQEGENKLINIFVIRRGGCSFVTKVKIAAEKCAHAVIIVDREDSNQTAEDLKHIIVADDGYGGSIEIPSVLISREQGQHLINSLESNQQIVAELAWDIPTDHVVNVDMWISSASRESLRFLKEFAPKRRLLNSVISFTPHYAVFGMDRTNPAVFNELCTTTDGQYCAEDPDGAGPVTGKDVLEEDVRQLCIHETYKKVSNDGRVQFSQEFWDYIEHLGEECPLDGPPGDNGFGMKCSKRLMRKFGINTDTIDECAIRSKEAKLKDQREHPAWSPRALRINGVKGGVTFGEMFSWLGITLLVAFAALLLYKRYLKKEMRARERLQVRQQRLLLDQHDGSQVPLALVHEPARGAKAWWSWHEQCSREIVPTRTWDWATGAAEVADPEEDKLAQLIGLLRLSRDGEGTPACQLQLGQLRGAGRAAPASVDAAKPVTGGAAAELQEAAGQVEHLQDVELDDRPFGLEALEELEGCEIKESDKEEAANRNRALQQTFRELATTACGQLATEAPKPQRQQKAFAEHAPPQKERTTEADGQTQEGVSDVFADPAVSVLIMGSLMRQRSELNFGHGRGPCSSGSGRSWDQGVKVGIGCRATVSVVARLPASANEAQVRCHWWSSVADRLDGGRFVKVVAHQSEAVVREGRITHAQLRDNGNADMLVKIGAEPL
ncbi:unnamed protein product [Prorocentrum cordatum]|uniref:PA domain-containing protein n=1 Tax=Prorocentrum cordatum TaxID=2364126 RepID=A0ABN9U517_9DINO|nr:unnamed protein product [Polarella glacialis]